jgi:fibrillarin-like rRNA methylase
MVTDTQFNLVIDAAERKASEYLNQAIKYENLGFPTIRDETYNDHYKPLREAIDALIEERSEQTITGKV